MTVEKYLENYEDLVGQIANDEEASLMIKAVLLAIEKSVHLKESKHKKYGLKILLARLLFHYEVALKDTGTHKEVIFWPAVKNHLDFMIPVSRELEKAGVSYTFVTNQQPLINILEQQDRHVTVFSINRTFQFNAGRFIRLNRIIATGKKLSKPFGKALDQALEHLHAIESYFAAYELVKQKLHPKYHLLGYGFSILGRVVGNLSQKDETPSGEIQHGTLNYRLMPYAQVRQLFLWDEVSRNTIKALAPASTELLVVGSPNPAHQQKAREEQENRNPLQLPSGIFEQFKTICLITFSGPGHNISKAGHEANIALLHELIPLFEDNLFVIRLHPKDAEKYYEALLRFPNVCLQPDIPAFKGLKVAGLMAHCDFVLTGASTVTFEAFQDGKPVVCMDVVDELNHMEFLKSELVYLAKNAEELKASLKSINQQDEIYKNKISLIKAYQRNYVELIQQNPSSVISKKIIDTIYY